MMTRNLHRIIGILLLLPFLGWAITGFVFFLKPGYAGAYEILQPKTYPLTGELSVKPAPEWLEFRYLKTILGEHLLTRTAAGWSHLDPRTMQPKTPPTEEEVRALITDAIAVNPSRYGQVASVAGDKIITTTGVTISLNWERLSLTQQGKDTERIDLLYRIHYLQWTGIPTADKVLGIIGLVMVLTLSALGATLFFTAGRKRS